MKNDAQTKNDPETLGYSDHMRYRRILRHATQAFLTHGYAGTAVEDIAIDANVSKVTIYRLFVDKLGLATDVLHDLSSSLEMHCRHAIDMAAPAEECLVHFGVTYVKWMIKNIGTTHHYAVSRLLMEMSTSHPDFAHSWVESHTRVIVLPLSQYIQKRIELGELSGEEDSFFMAAQFLGNLIHTPGIIVLNHNLAIAYNVDDIAALVKRKVRLFLRGWQKR